MTTTAGKTKHIISEKFDWNLILTSAGIATAIAGLSLIASIYFQSTVLYSTVGAIFNSSFYLLLWRDEGFILDESGTQPQTRLIWFVSHPVVRGLVGLLLLMMFALLVS